MISSTMYTQFSGKTTWFFLLIALAMNLSYHGLLAQNTTLSGYVQDHESGERLIGASLFLLGQSQGTQTNAEGFFSLAVPSDSAYVLIARYIGYDADTLEISGSASSLLMIRLRPSFTLESVEIISSANQLGTLSLNIDKVKMLPALGGEIDPMRAFQLLPGVTGGSEGTSALYVRGGSPDQNLILLDDVPLYYVNHIGGFLSIFDPSSIKKMRLIKGGFPARYGGRLSSVLEVNVKDGHQSQLQGNLRLSFLSSGLTLEGPLGKNRKTTFMVSGRRSFVDLFTRIGTRLSSSGEFSAGYAFFDLNGKITHRISDKDILSFSVYHGRDQFVVRAREEEKETNTSDQTFLFKGKTKLNWGNTLGALRWQHLFHDKLHGKAIIGYTRFQYLNTFETEQVDTQVDSLNAEFLRTFRSSVRDIFIKTHLDWYPSLRHHIELGATITYHQFEPQSSVFTQQGQNVDTIDLSSPTQLLSAWELNTYIADTWQVNSRLRLNLGVHLASFGVEGKNYTSVQPRLSIHANPTRRLHLSFAYSRMQQNLHLLSNSNAGFPTDLWVPATARVAPQQSWQTSMGINYSLDQAGSWQIGVEGFYKKMSHLIDFAKGSNIFSIENNWESEIIQAGTGEVYGSEWLLEKRKGKLTGWIGYTLSWNWRRFVQIDEGRRFPFTFDRRHDLSVVMNYALSTRVSLSVNWNYASGRAISLSPGFVPTLTLGIPTPKSSLSYGLKTGHLQPQRNNYRMPAYHRLDFTANFTKELPKNKGTRTWRLGLYNAYSRLNPYFVYFDTNDQGALRLMQYSLFPILPAISFERSF